MITLGRRAVRLYPIYHPAAALYTPRMLETLREDFARLPGLLELGPPEQLEVGPPDQIEVEEVPAPAREAPAPAREAPAPAPEAGDPTPQAGQLGLF